MGYTHYWYRPQEFDSDRFKMASDDCHKVCEASGIKLADAHGIEGTSPLFCHELVSFNGVKPESCETFHVPRFYERANARPDPEGYFQFCKTRVLPYDLVVMACLIVFKHHFNGKITVASDGEPKDWKEAIELCQRVLGYGKLPLRPRG